MTIRNHHRSIVRATALFALAWLGLSLAACKVNDHDVETWKGTVKGPSKMVAVMLADKYDIPLRTHAALALVAMDRQDVDGVAELQQAMQALEGKVRDAILDGLAPGLVAQMEQKPSQEEADSDVETGPPPHQVRAKDAAFLLIPMATPKTKALLTNAVMDWYVEDFNGRNLSGNFSAEQVIRALGAPAAQKLVDALNAKLPQQALIKLAELIGQLGGTKTRANAAKKLVAIEQEMNSPAYVKWLSDQIHQQLAAAGAKVDEARVQKMVALNQASFVEGAAIPAMKYLASEPVVAERLLAIAETKDEALTTRRTRALMALEGSAKPEQLDRLLALALDAEAPVPVRDYAFDRVGDLKDPRAIPPMWPLVQNSEDQRLRWRAGEMVLAIGGPTIVPEFFKNLPAAPDTPYEPEELEGYATRMGQMSPLPDQLVRSKLASSHWWDQVIALRYLQRKGTLADVPSMEHLKGQQTPVVGEHWEGVKNVGMVAEAAVAGLRERIKQADAAKNNAS